MKSFAMMMTGGILGLAILKLLGTFLLPLLAAAFGFVALMLKIALVVAVGYFVMSLFRGRRGRDTAEV